jgi:glycine/D-amino acid oxidase-like deaminating enzyme
VTPARDAEHVDAVVVGATIRGLVTSYVLSTLGFQAVLLERSPRIGGADGSFVTDAGTVFDHGLHVLDHDRSEVATRLFTHVVDGAVHRLVLQRGIVLRGIVLPYAPAPSELPDELRALLAGDELVDDIGDDLPTRDRLGRVYGEGWADLVYDEVLPSFPSEARHRAFGVEGSRLLVNVYPWFFPRARREPSSDESRSFHDRLRAGVPQEILYPARGGFGGFARGFLDKLDPKRVEVLTDARDVHVEVAPGTHRVDAIVADGRRFRANHYFWAEGWPSLCRVLSLPCQDAATDRVVLGSFRLDRPAHTPYHEILVGDPRCWINRVHFPGAFRGSDDALMQIEFAVPVHEDGWPSDPDEWRARWTEDGRRLGILDDDHRIEEFDVRSFVMHFNAFGAEGEPLRDADPTLLDPDSNVRPVVPSMANLNLNRYVSRAIAYVTSVLAG